MNAYQRSEKTLQVDPVDINSLKGKTFVAKLGGSALEHQCGVLQDLIQLQMLGGHPVLVHGGGPLIIFST